MAAGKFRERALIERNVAPAEDVGALGAVAPQWEPIGDCAARVEPLGGRELYAARQVQPDASHKVTLRGSPLTLSITPRDRVLVGKRVFEITAATPDERSAFVVLTCTERVGP